MKNMMTVVRLVEIGKVALSQEPIPHPLPSEVLVQVKTVGICGSDSHYFLHGGLGSFKSKLPLSFGHEAAGVVVNPGNTKWQKGDRVAIDPNNNCGNCYYCLKGQHNLCINTNYLGANNYPGALQEYITVSPHQLVYITPTISFAEAALLEPFSVALHAINLTKINIGDTVAIYGAGAIGLCLLACCKLAGAQNVIVIDQFSHRLQLAKKQFGASFVINTGTKDDSVEQIKNTTNGTGVDISIDAVGAQVTFANCLKATKPGGKLLLVGIPTQDYLQYNPHIARTKELLLINSRRSNQTLETAVHLLNNKQINLRQLITHTFPITKSQLAFETAALYKDKVIKTIISL